MNESLLNRSEAYLQLWEPEAPQRLATSARRSSFNKRPKVLALDMVGGFGL
jgi:hypothetical protein